MVLIKCLEKSPQPLSLGWKVARHFIIFNRHREPFPNKTKQPEIRFCSAHQLVMRLRTSCFLSLWSSFLTWNTGVGVTTLKVQSTSISGYVFAKYKNTSLCCWVWRASPDGRYSAPFRRYSCVQKYSFIEWLFIESLLSIRHWVRCWDFNSEQKHLWTKFKWVYKIPGQLIFCKGPWPLGSNRSGFGFQAYRLLSFRPGPHTGFTWDYSVCLRGSASACVAVIRHLFICILQRSSPSSEFSLLVSSSWDEVLVHW